MGKVSYISLVEFIRQKTFEKTSKGKKIVHNEATVQCNGDKLDTV